MRAAARVLGAIGLIALPLFAAPAVARAQARWTPRLGIGVTRWLGDVGEESTPVALAARAQLLRSAEGSFAWGPEVAYYTFGTYDGGAECANPECTELIPRGDYTARALTVGLASRVGARGGRRGIYGALGLAWMLLWEDGSGSYEGASLGGLSADLGLGYAFVTSPGLFVELRGHGAVLEDDGFVGGGAFLSLMGGVSL